MDKFIWGAATSAYQIEGAALKDGKGPSIWDGYCQIPGKIRHGDSGAEACDHYHRFNEDVALLKQLGVDSYRFSISWPRVMPMGRGQINKPGIAFYHKLIDALLEAGIEPMVTLYHWDMPLALQIDYGGLLSPSFPALFEDYADLCFREFGGKVKRWITINEPWVISVLANGTGVDNPATVSPEGTYVYGRHLLLGHARAVRLYREKYKSSQKGEIGITLNCDWRYPYSEDPLDRAAAEQSLAFALRWFADPVFHGVYPEEMHRRLGARLPGFSAEESALLKGSTEFFGLNHYSAAIAKHADIPNPMNPHEDVGVALSASPEWAKTAMGWPVVPDGFGRLLEWISDRYPDTDIYVTENGCAAPYTDEASAINDQFRVDYLERYIKTGLERAAKGVRLKGYFVWSLLDNFEWASGYEPRFGIVHVDYKTQKRTQKASFEWYRRFIAESRKNSRAA